jgi:hypothetical protein
VNAGVITPEAFEISRFYGARIRDESARIGDASARSMDCGAILGGRRSREGRRVRRNPRLDGRDPESTSP